MNDERERLRLMICLIQNAENTKREEIITEQRYESLSRNANAKDRIDELLDQNKISEYQRAFHQFDEASEISHDCFNRLQKIKKQTSETGTSLRRFFASQP